jgi:hypothetical protein
MNGSLQDSGCKDRIIIQFRYKRQTETDINLKVMRLVISSRNVPFL